MHDTIPATNGEAGAKVRHFHCRMAHELTD